jgi:transposase
VLGRRQGELAITKIRIVEARAVARARSFWLCLDGKEIQQVVRELGGIQVIERASGETDSGKVVRALKSTYKRHGTLNLFAALEVDTGQVHTKFTEYKKREDFRSFLDGVLADQPENREIHVILDNYSTHKRNDDWLAKFEGRVQFHCTPTSASWLNQIEIVFSLLQRKTLSRNCSSVARRSAFCFCFFAG